MIKNISVILRSLFCSEGSVVLLIAGIVAYLFSCVSLAYSKESGPFNALCGVAIFSMAALAVVVMASHIHSLVSRKTISLLARGRMALVIAGFSLCAICTVFVTPYIYLMKASFMVAVAFMAAFFCMYSFILFLGVFLAKYVTPAISFGLALIAMPLIGAMIVKLIGSEPHPLFVIAFMLLFTPAMWLLFGVWFLRKRQEKFDDGSNWARRVGEFFSRVMHSSDFSTGVGAMLLNNGDSTKAMVRRSLIVIGSFLLLWSIMYVTAVWNGHTLAEVNTPKTIWLFCFFQMIYVETSNSFYKLKNIWLLADGDRPFVLHLRNRLVRKMIGIHYGITLVIVLSMLCSHVFAGSLQHIIIMLLIMCCMVTHFFVIAKAMENDRRVSILIFAYPIFTFGDDLVDISAAGAYSLSSNYIAWGFVLLPLFAVIAIAYIPSKNSGKIDFTKRELTLSFFKKAS